MRWEPFVYIHIFTSGGLTFDSVVLSGTDGFEFDNVVVSTQTQTPIDSLVRIGSIVSLVDPPEVQENGQEEDGLLATTGSPNLALAVIMSLGLLVVGIGLLRLKPARYRVGIGAAVKSRTRGTSK